MTSQSTQPADRGPLPLFRMLEQEYEALHGPLPQSYKDLRADAIARARPKLEQATMEEEKAGIEAELNHTLFAELTRELARAKSAALCFSGGGIRSATFNLGVLQGLARHGLLGRFHYLSTVSGGGYVGSWLSSWIARNGRQEVMEELKAPPPSRFDPEPGPLRHLRNYSNYLTPRLGLLTADTWTLVATYLRNLLINWLVWVPLLLAALALPRLVIEVAQLDPKGWFPHAETIVPGAGIAVGLGLALVSIVYTCLAMPSVRDAMTGHYGFFLDAKHQERWINATQGSFIRWWYAPLAVAGMLLAASWAWLRHEGSAASDTAFLDGRDEMLSGMLPYMAVGVGVHLMGWISANVVTWWRGGGVRRPADGWSALRTFRGTYSPNELLAIVLSGLVAGVGLWVAATKVFPTPGSEKQFGLYASLAVPLLLLVFLTAASVYVALASYWTTDEDREWWARAMAWIMIGMVLWAGVSLSVIFGPVWLFNTDHYTALLGAAGGVTGIIALVLGFSARTRPNEDEETEQSWATAVRKLAPVLAAPVAIVALVAALSLATSRGMEGVPRLVDLPPHGANGTITEVESYPGKHLSVLHHTNGVGLLIALAWSLLFGIAMATLININRFSLHAIYRNRLIRAYLGASNERRCPNPFTGFDPKDNIEMAAMAPNANEVGQTRLFHVVNIALNLVKKDKEKLAWQERKAESFTVSPLHAGNWRLGYRSAKQYGRNKTGRAISLGTAVAISGAAASPNMGYHSSPAVTFLMTLFNIRLGWWLGNPGKAGQETFGKSSPELAIGPIIQEALGFTNDRNPYVYLSDGGHFENLGLYEMVLRRARFIVMVDAGQDDAHGFQDLGNAIRKIRVDLGIPVVMGDMNIVSRDAQRLKPVENRKCCAIGTIEYSRVDGTNPMDDGMLIYVKPTLCGNEPTDVRNYAETHERFPHEPTNDQWFSESQFESYRALGFHQIEQLCREDLPPVVQGIEDDPLSLFQRRVEHYLAREAGAGRSLQGDLIGALQELAAKAREPKGVL